MALDNSTFANRNFPTKCQPTEYFPIQHSTNKQCPPTVATQLLPTKHCPIQRSPNEHFLTQYPPTRHVAIQHLHTHYLRNTNCIPVTPQMVNHVSADA